jgi:hypothetical protein
MQTVQRRTLRRSIALLFSIMAIMAAMSANALADPGVEVLDYPSGEPCPAVTVEGNSVKGGCLLSNWQGTMTLMASSSVVFDSCWGTFGARVDSAGQLYAVDQEMRCNWPRKACEDELTGKVLPGAGQLHALGNGEFSADLAMCIEQSSGSFHYWLTVPFAVELNPLMSSPVALDQTSGVYNPGGYGGIEGAHFDIYSSDTVSVIEVEGEEE